ncbi:DnaJ-domain-containing protein [Gonapodya prolifera JEL478]|uniref:DnaJ-domain-containing protein n=1 Tax=Gonapodya prolifera (strain JEL478) TaxID=1344416 RepID=A0A139AYX8_GONPJ|nr:DnaJ-domain-containing protein [Gonapodya prolifera JEL478]|eukprot:KXS21763.1 DnaJ-domain-containing protein [Gonapodya prolifera JEL478]
MHETRETKDWLASLERSQSADADESSKSNGHAQSNRRDDTTSTSGPRRRAAPTSSSSSSSSSSLPSEPASPPRSYTPSQEQECQRIIRAKGDFYAVLGVEKGCPADEIKKAYRKLALQFHPDKNSAPGASEAFKAIGRAFGCLSDETKRARYDQLGVDPDARATSSGGGGGGMGRGFRTDFETELTPEDIFNMFFGGEFGPQFARGPNGNVYRVYRSGGQRRGFAQAADDSSDGNMFARLAPLALLFFVWIMMAVMAPSADTTRQFSFSQHPSYPIRRETTRNHVEYWVTPKFPHIQPPSTQALRRDLAAVENQVEGQYLQHLRGACEHEMDRKRMAIARARGLWTVDEQRLRAAQAMETPACEEIRKFRH